ncbi:uncharacterized protein F4822DRAFT_442542 [Hypoxylon trugodes]|uniref:uncharacterized protein n=1 Tax=Hypoxylon trugodes TaxID=326681 RepID=UPI0021958E63|nr:uncharacterized protein F4822DRAFT_442542 [Hypoxylon trugodes]KAI1391610.1 hypothetical protein F4822DRAFT_442542 [Hypoxylon trugodes]
MEPPRKRRRVTSPAPPATSQVTGQHGDTSPSPLSVTDRLSGIIQDDTVASSSQSSFTQDVQKGMICFGLLRFSVINITPLNNDRPISVHLNGGRVCKSWGQYLARIGSQDLELVQLFLREKIEVELWMPHRTKQSFVAATLYGEESLGEPLKKVLETLNLYLQDPIYSSRDVCYWNPQRFFNADIQLTSMFSWESSVPTSRQEQSSATDFLATFSTETLLPETEGSPFLQTPLQKHQKQALTFMIRREHGWNLQVAGTDV